MTLFRLLGLLAIVTATLLLSSAIAGDDKSKPLDHRVAAVERRLDEVERRLRTLEKAIQGPREQAPVPQEPRKLKEPLIGITLTSKKYHKGDVLRGDAGDRIDFVFKFASRVKRNVRAFSGTVVFRDLFGDIIMQVTLKHTDGLKAGGTAEWSGGIEYNQFLDRHRNLRAASKRDLKTEFVLDQIIYTDGTREVFRQDK